MWKRFIFAGWIAFILCMVFLVDVKHTRYKLIGMELSLLFIAGLWIMEGAGSIGKKFFSGITAPVISISAIYIIFYLFSPDRLVAYSQLQRMLFSSLALLAALYMIPEGNAITLLKTTVLCGGLISIYAVLQHYGGVWRIGVPKLARVFATFGNPNFFASFLAGLIPVSIALYWEKKKIWMGTAVFVMFVAVYFTFSRGAWLGIIAAAAFWWFFMSSRRSLKHAAAALAVIAVIFLLTRHIWMRETQRLLIWRDTLNMFAHHPVFGIGIGRFYAEFPSFASQKLLAILPPDKVIVNYAHNEFLEMLAETGLAGFGVYVWLLAVFFVSGLRNRKDGLIYNGATCGAFAVLVHSAVSVNMRFAVASIWAFFLLGFGAAAQSFPEERSPASNAGARIFKGIIMLALFSVAAAGIIAPLRYQKMLSGEVDFFRRPAEFSEAQLKKSLEDDPGQAMAHYKLGWEQAKKKEFQKAIISFNKAIELDSSLVGAYNNLGNIYYTIGKRDLAVKYYNEALKRNPGLVDAHFNLGYIYHHKGLLKEAVKEFKKVIELDPDNYKAKIMLEKMVQ